MGLFDRKKPTRQLKMLPLALIDPNPEQPRRDFDQTALNQLAQSIKENGLLNPISVRRCGDRYQIIAGERRYKAHLLLGLDEIAAVVETADDTRSAQLAIIENLQRCDLNFYEEAAAIEKLIKCCGLTQQQAAERIGISQSAVANKLRLLKLPQFAITQLLQAELTERHARAMLPLANDDRLESVIRRTAENRLNVVQTERLVQSMAEAKKQPRKGRRKLVVKDLRIFNTAIVRAVDMMKQAGIDAVSQKTEDEQNIVYTVVIPKPKIDSAINRR